METVVVMFVWMWIVQELFAEFNFFYFIASWMIVFQNLDYLVESCSAI